MNIDKFALPILDKLALSVRCSSLSDTELRGVLVNVSYLKLFRGNKLDFPFVLGRSIRGLSFKDQIHKDAFGTTIAGLRDYGDTETVFGALYSRYREERSLTAADIISLSNRHALAAYPAWALVLPWENMTVLNRYSSYLQQLQENRRSYLPRCYNDVDVESSEFPYSPTMARTQITQSYELLKSVRKKYHFTDADLPKVNILMADGEWRWFMSWSGNHRAYILSALDYSAITARIDRVIRRSDYLRWNNVGNGLFSPSEALKIFDQVFLGEELVRGII